MAQKHTFPMVLVHGAWHGAWCWAKVLPKLREKGFRVFTPTQTGVGERTSELSKEIRVETFIQDIADFLTTHDLHDVILVGHSFAGISISGVADRMPERIRHLVYLDALLLQSGQKVFDIIPPDLAAARRELAMQTSQGLSLPAPEPAALGVTDEVDAQWVKENCTPHPLSTYDSNLHLNHPLGNGLPASYIAVMPHYLVTTSSRDYARLRSDWKYLEIQAGHDAMVTSPAQLCRLLEDVASLKPVRKPSMEDRVLKFIEGHNREIWTGIALLVVLVVVFK